MRDDRPNPNWPGSTYNGFAGPAVAVEAPPGPRPSQPPPRRMASPWVLGGVATAIAAGVALGFAAQPNDVSAAKAEAAATPLPVELVAATATPATRPAGQLDVRPSAETAPPRVTAPQPLALPPAAEPAAPSERLGPPPAIREAPPPELELDRPAADEPEVYEEVEEPAGPA